MKSDAGFLMSQIKHISGRVWEKMLNDYGIEAFNGAQGRILYVLWEKGPMTITGIGKLTSLAPTTLTSMLDRMERGGLTERIPDKANRRQIIIKLTEKAKEYREEYNKLCGQMNNLTYEGFSEAELRDFEDKLNRIIGNLKKADK